jgi:general transcriptional corepressor TUP1
MTSDGRWIVSGSEDRSVIFWNAETGEPHLVMEGHDVGVMELASGHSSRIFATAGGDRKVRLWSYSE